MRRDAIAIFHAGVNAADPAIAIRSAVRLKGDVLHVGDAAYGDIGRRKIHVVGAGKASAHMAETIETLLGDYVSTGTVTTKYGHSGGGLKKISVIEAAHPVPDANGVTGTRAILNIVEQAGPNDIIMVLISGGGSALMPLPADSVTLADKQQTTQVLLECGATIHEINAIRKHISQTKGGRFARHAHPRQVISLILSDVVGDSLDSIASGPTVPDSSTFGDCLAIVDRYSIEKRIPISVRDYLQAGARGEHPETPKAGEGVFQRVQNLIVGSNRLALDAAEHKCRDLGYSSMILSSVMTGETKEVAAVHGAIAREIVAGDRPLRRPACVLSGGETTVTIRGQGLGGRNQEFVLAGALAIEGLENTVMLSGGTDGTDGPTDAAGAIADNRTMQRAQELGMSGEAYLRDNDAYHFFSPLDDLLMTGPTHTNVMDLRMILVT